MESFEHDDWWIYLSPLQIPSATLTDHKPSYTIFVAVPHHSNEQRNILDKLDDACTNLANHGRTQSNALINIVCVHLPAQVSFAACQRWVEEYLELHPNSPISGVCLYQPVVTTTDDGLTSHILHAWSPVFRPSIGGTWFESHPTTLAITVGVPSSKPSELRLKINSQEFKLEDYYVFQRGNIYEVHEWSNGQPLTGQASYQNGITTHSVLKLSGGTIDLSGKFSPVSELWLV